MGIAVWSVIIASFTIFTALTLAKSIKPNLLKSSVDSESIRDGIVESAKSLMHQMRILIALMSIAVIAFIISFAAFSITTLSGYIGKVTCYMIVSGTLTLISVFVGIVLNDLIALQTRRKTRKANSIPSDSRPKGINVSST